MSARSGLKTIQACLRHVEDAPLCDDPQEYLQRSLALSALLHRDLEGGTLEELYRSVFSTNLDGVVDQTVKRGKDEG